MSKPSPLGSARSRTILQVPFGLWLLLAGAICLVRVVAAYQDASQATDACARRQDRIVWLEQALGFWRESAALLELPVEPWPWLFAFDEECEWQVGWPVESAPTGGVLAAIEVFGKPVPVHRRTHGGSLTLPGGQAISVEPRTHANYAPSLARPYVVLALPAVFRAFGDGANDPRLEDRLLGVVSHEILHTRQLPDLVRQVGRLRDKVNLPAPLDDNVVERVFRSNPDFRAAFVDERDRLFEAVFTADDGLARNLARGALGLMTERRARFFSGPDEVFARLEELFLNLEGVAEWVRFQVYRARGCCGSTTADIVQFMRGRDNEWVQDEGLALLLLIDRWVPNWPGRLLSPDLPSPAQVLRDALTSPGESLD